MAWSFAAWNLSGGLPGEGVFRISIKKKRFQTRYVLQPRCFENFFLFLWSVNTTHTQIVKYHNKEELTEGSSRAHFRVMERK